MKLWKKILIGFFILAVIGIGLAAYGVSKISDTYTEKIEPDMKRYVQMTKEEQNEYVLVHMEELLATASQPEELKYFQEAIKNNPEFRQAGIDWGRSICAIFIVMSEEISGGLSEEEKAMYKAEADARNERDEKFTKMLEQNQVTKSKN